jgi:Kef-type K+ transport system membrane component KefB
MPDDLLPLSDPGAVFAVLFLLVLIGPIVAQWLRLPAIIGLIVAGMLVGPNVLGVLDENTFIETIGYVGLLYLMFEGGLDLDLDGFRARRRESIVFGVLTFVFPMVIVTSVALALGLGVLASVIIGSAFTSHTLLSYPTISRLDLTRIPSVTATLGATLLATTGALLVLAIAVAAAGGDAGVWYWVRFLAGLVIYLLVMLLVVPRFTRWFFTGLAQNRQVRMTYLLSGMGIAAVVAGMVGIEPIVGAFIAGLAFNRFVPHGTAIEARVKILGESVFIPAFLISTGMLLDPVSLVADPRTLLLGGAFTAALVASKLTASELVGRLMRVSLPERGVMFSSASARPPGRWLPW